MLDIVATRLPGVRVSSGSSRAVSAKCPRWLTPSCSSNPSAVRPSSTRHEAGVVHEQVEPVVLGREAVGEGGDRGQVGQVERPDVDQRGRQLPQQLPAGGVGAPGVAAGEHDRAPRAASTRATSSPRPELAPVTTARRPVWSGTSASVQLVMVVLDEDEYGFSFARMLNDGSSCQRESRRRPQQRPDLRGRAPARRRPGPRGSDGGDRGAGRCRRRHPVPAPPDQGGAAAGRADRLRGTARRRDRAGPRTGARRGSGGCGVRGAAGAPGGPSRRRSGRQGRGHHSRRAAAR